MASIQTVMTSEGLNPRMLYFGFTRFNKGKGPRAFYDSPHDKFSWMNKYPKLIPSPQDILQYQREIILLQIKNNPSVNSPVIEQLNSIMMDKGYLSPIQHLSELFLYGDNIRERTQNGTVGLLGVAKDIKAGGITYESIAYYLENSHSLLLRYKLALEELMASIDNGFGSNKTKQLVKKMEEIYNHMIQIYQQGHSLIIENSYSGNSVGHVLTDSDKNLIPNMIAVALQLRGVWLEDATYETCLQHNTNNFSTPFNSLTPYAMGKINLPYFDLFDKNKYLGKAQARMDTALIDTNKLESDLKAAGYMQFTWTINKKNKKGTILEFLNDIQESYTKEYSIVFNGNGDPNSMMNIMEIFYKNVQGFQAKSGMGKKINFLNKTKGGGRQLTVEEMLKNSLGNIQLKALRDLYILKNIYKAHFVEKSKYYSALYNYNLGHFVYKIIGEENQFMVTSQGITSVNKWLENMLNKNRAIFHATSQVSILAGDPGPSIAFGQI